MEKMDFIAYHFSLNGNPNEMDMKQVPEDKIIDIQLFQTNSIFGSYFSCIFKGRLRIHVTFTKDNTDYNDKILTLIHETFLETKLSEGTIWINNRNFKILEYLEKQLNLERDPETFVYESHEMIMPREKFKYTFDDSVLEVRPYQEEHIDDYLSLLYHSMSFKIPPYNYIGKKDSFMEEFRIMKEQHTFEAFWKQNELVGLYWISGTEVDHLVVDEKYQRSGYGKQILTRAIERVFQNPDNNVAWLLVVGWNSKAFNFYKKFGLEEKEIYYVPYEEED